MHVVTFQLSGDLALWRNCYEPVGSYSGLGPAPSHIAGLLGAVMGWASPLSYAAQKEATKQKPDNKKTKKKAIGPIWAVAPSLLDWQKEQDVHLACAWIGGNPRRTAWNIKGFKDANMETLRLQQQVIVRPSYMIAVALKEDEAADALTRRLRCPLFPVFLGESAFRGILTNVDRAAFDPRKAPYGWAYRTDKLGLGEQMPFTRHYTEHSSHNRRIGIDGFWVYPTPLHTPPRQGDIPWVRCYAEDETNVAP